jgi:hypothetical protein
MRLMAAGVCLKALERRDNSIRRYDQELIELGLYLWLELRSENADSLA